MKKLVLFAITLIFIGSNSSARIVPNHFDRQLEKNYQTGRSHRATARRPDRRYSERFELGANFAINKYEEPTVMHYNGTQLGVNLATNLYNEAKTFRFRGEIEYSSGVFKYYGGVTNLNTHVTTPSIENGTETYRYVRVTLGIPQTGAGSTLFTPYFGIAQRYLDNHIGGTGSYRREITYYYAPIGIEAASVISDRIRLRGSLEYEMFLAGTVVSHITEAGFPDDLYNKQSDGTGLRATFAFDYKLDSITLSAQPYVQYWKIQQSDVGAYGLGEPLNNTLTFGIVGSVLL